MNPSPPSTIMHPDQGIVIRSFSSSLSFSSYATNTPESTAARAIHDAADEEDYGVEEHDICGFEFGFPVLMNTEMEESAAAALVYPLFDRKLLKDFEPEPPAPREESRLFNKERVVGGHCSSSSSEADDLEGFPAETYCLWAQKKWTASRCTKSSSIGATTMSKPWRLRDLLLNRTKSDGTDHQLVLLTTNGSGKKADWAPKVKPKTAARCINRDANHNKRRSYLPYRQDLIGLFHTSLRVRTVSFTPF